MHLLWILQQCYLTAHCRGSAYVNFSALKIHMSENAHTAIMAFPEFITERRGEISVKVERKISYCIKNILMHNY